MSLYAPHRLCAFSGIKFCFASSGKVTSLMTFHDGLMVGGASEKAKGRGHNKITKPNSE